VPGLFLKLASTNNVVKNMSRELGRDSKFMQLGHAYVAHYGSQNTYSRYNDMARNTFDLQLLDSTTMSSKKTKESSLIKPSMTAEAIGEEA